MPFKGGATAKQRLAPAIGGDQRAALARKMHAHVIACLAACPQVERTLTLSPRSDGLPGAWWADEGRGLNAELAAARQALAGSNLLVVHADLPLLEPGDIAALTAAAERSGLALAPDRHGAGTNAIALRNDAPFRFGFGEGSFAAHARQGTAEVVERRGLSHDVDTPDDLQHIVSG